MAGSPNTFANTWTRRTGPASSRPSSGLEVPAGGPEDHARRVIRLNAHLMVRNDTGEVLPAKLADLSLHLRVEALSPAAALRAAELLTDHRQEEGVCNRCLNSAIAFDCPECGAKVPRERRFADMLLLAQAITDEETQGLYTYDKGILSMVDRIEDAPLRAARPPNPDGELFDTLESQRGNVIPIKKTP